MVAETSSQRSAPCPTAAKAPEWPGFGAPRHASAEMDPADAAGEQRQLDHEQAVERRQREWFASHARP